MQRWTVPFRERRKAGASHPVHDFLFVYYQYSPAKLEQWHPGIGVILEQAASPSVSEHWFPDAYYSSTGPQHQDRFCDPSKIDDKTVSRLKWTVELLQRTSEHRPNFSCLGLHEWAMVYQGHEIRHEKTTPLRLPQQEIDRIVESRPLTCTHFDAFRFFAQPAQPLNHHQPTLDDRPSLEQPACIHANMDLYKWAFKSMPWIGSELLAECFELALQARLIDMRASPYDVSAFIEDPPIQIETSAGRATYEREQRRIFELAQPLRRRLKERIEFVIMVAS